MNKVVNLYYNRAKRLRRCPDNEEWHFTWLPREKVHVVAWR